MHALAVTGTTVVAGARHYKAQGWWCLIVPAAITPFLARSFGLETVPLKWRLIAVVQLSVASAVWLRASPHSCNKPNPMLISFSDGPPLGLGECIPGVVTSFKCYCTTNCNSISKYARKILTKMSYDKTCKHLLPYKIWDAMDTCTMRIEKPKREIRLWIVWIGVVFIEVPQATTLFLLVQISIICISCNIVDAYITVYIHIFHGILHAHLEVLF